MRLSRKFKAASATALAWILGSHSSEIGLPVLPAPHYLRHCGKGRNKHPRRCSGVAAAKRAARKKKAKK